MNTRKTLEKAFETADFWVQTLLSDLTDADLLTRPTPDANHIAWQFGHLIASEVGLVSTAIPTAAYRLPPGFKEQHSKANAFINDPANNVYFHCYFDVQAGDGAHQLSPGKNGDETTIFPLASAKFKTLFGG